MSTCRRYVSAAEEDGIALNWIHGDAASLARQLSSLLVDAPADTLLHGHHAIRTGPALLGAKRPFVVSLGGTEAEFLERDPLTAPLYEEVLLKAQRVLVAGADSYGYLAALGIPHERVSLVPRGVEVSPRCPPPRHPKAVGPLRERCRVDAACPLVFLPSGLRPGKDPLAAIALVEKVRESSIDAHLAIAGMRLDAATSDAVEARACTLPWVHLLAPFDFATMDAVYADADVILNTSRFEGMSNALLEAQAAARPVLATNIRANVDGLAPELRATAFHDPMNAAQTLQVWLIDPIERKRLGSAAYTFVRDHFSLAAERDALLAAWCSVPT